MRVFTYSEARQKLSAVLDMARREDVVIARRGGEAFRLTYKAGTKSPFDVPGIRTKATTLDILTAIKESRERESEQTNARDGECAARDR